MVSETLVIVSSSKTGWRRSRRAKNFNSVSLSDQERTGYLPKLIEDLIVRLRSPNICEEENDSICSAAVAHGKMRKSQGYTPAMLVHDSRILQVTLFGTLQKHFSAGFQPFQLAVARCHDHRG